MWSQSNYHSISAYKNYHNISEGIRLQLNPIGQGASAPWVVVSGNKHPHSAVSPPFLHHVFAMVEKRWGNCNMGASAFLTLATGQAHMDISILNRFKLLLRAEAQVTICHNQN